MCFSCHDRMFPAALVCSVSRKCCTIPFFGRFLESCHIAHPRSHGKVPKKLVRGYEIGGKTAFRQEKCCTIQNLPRKSGSCDKICRFPTRFLISWQVFSAWCLSWAWCSEGGMKSSVAGYCARRERVRGAGGNRYRYQGQEKNDRVSKTRSLLHCLCCLMGIVLPI